MTSGRALTLVEFDTELYRSTQFELSEVDRQPLRWTNSVGSDVAGDGARFTTGFWLERDAGFTGAADSKMWTFSAWVYLDSGGAGTLRWVFEDQEGESNRLVIIANNTFEVTGVNSAGVVILRITSNIALPFDEWVHVMFSVDLNNPANRHLYVNDTSSLSVVTYTNDTMDFTKTDWAVGAQIGGTNPLTGGLAYFWNGFGTYIDLSVEANRRKFITEDLLPADLGPTGAIPTGVAPIVYLAGDISTWHNNKGTGGGFTLFSGSPATGTLARVEEAIRPNSTFLGIEDEEFLVGKGARLTAISNTQNIWTYDLFPDSESCSILALVKPQTAASEPAVMLRVSEGTSDLEAYQLSIGGNTGMMRIGRFHEGAFTVLVDEEFTMVPGRAYWMRFDCVAMTSGTAFLRAKVWEHGDTEPDLFMISVEDDLVEHPFPTFLDNAGTVFNTETTTHNVPMPAIVNEGDLLIVRFSVAGEPFAPSITTPAGWTRLHYAVIYSPGFGFTSGRMGIYVKRATGTEGGTNVNFVTTGSNDAETGVAQVSRVAAGDWFGDIAQGVAVGGVVVDNNNEAGLAPNPGNFNPGWGSLNILWLAWATWVFDGVGAVGFPAGYTSLGNTVANLGGHEVGVASAFLEAQSSAQNPGPFTISEASPWIAGVIAVRPLQTTPESLPAGKVGVKNYADAVDFGFFRARSLLDEHIETLRFAEPAKKLPLHFNAITNIKNIQDTTATISLGENLGKRATVTVDFTDHPLAENGEFYNNGTFWSRFRARTLFKKNYELRILRGYAGEELDNFTRYTYFLDKFDGPSIDGKFTIIAQDPLKAVENERAQAPILSNGSLAGTIDGVTTSAELAPSGIGDAEYPASGKLCLGGKEIVSFTRSGDNLTITRGQNNTVGISHTAGERAQLVLEYTGDDVADIIFDLLSEYTDIDDDLLPLAEWQAETNAFLSVIYSRVITEPTSVKKLLEGLIEQAALALWWDPVARLVKLRVLRPVGIGATNIDEGSIILDTLKTREQFDKRKSQIWVAYGQRNAADRGDNEDNYRNSLALVDLESEFIYGSQEIKKISASWIQTQSAAERLTQIYLSRFSRPPRNFTFSMDPSTNIQMGEAYRLLFRRNQTEYGLQDENGAPIQITRISVDEGIIHVEAEEMLAFGELVLTNTVFLLSTGSLLNWTVPDDWNPDENSIHCIGGGGGGGRAMGAGGGGGAYSGVTNVALTPGSLIPYQVGIGGPGATLFSDSVDGGDTWFGAPAISGSIVAAKGGEGGDSNEADAPAIGGQASEGVGTIKTSGGNGAPATTAGDDQDEGGGGGGGAGGPNGNGANGATNQGNSRGGGGGGAGNGGDNGHTNDGDTGGRGGDNRFNFGGGNGDEPHGQESGGGGGGTFVDDEGPGVSGNGGIGEQLWTQSIAPIIGAGPGGGGGGSCQGSSFGSSIRGGNGGLYGGGGGGGGSFNTRGGDGAQGIIVITWKSI